MKYKISLSSFIVNIILLLFTFTSICNGQITLQVISTTINTITISYSTDYPVRFNVSVDGIGSISTCQNVLAGTCYIGGLYAPGQFTVVVTSSPYGFAIPSYTASQVVNLYSSLQAPVVSSISTPDSITLNYYSGGANAQTTYQVWRNNVLICNNVPENYCDNNGLLPYTPYIFKVQAAIMNPAGGGVFSPQVDYVAFTMPNPPTGTTINGSSNVQMNQLTLNWEESKDGMPGENTYSILIYNPRGSELPPQTSPIPSPFPIPNTTTTSLLTTTTSTTSTTTTTTLSQYYLPGECQKVNGTSCTLKNILSGTSYNISIVTHNSNYSDVQSPSPYFVSTLPQVNFTCTNNCSNHGDCISGVCSCYNGWNGITCETNTTLEEQKNTTANSTWVNIDAETASFRFDLGELVERDIDGNPVKSLPLSSLNWTYYPIVTTNVTDPTTQTQFILKQWVYSSLPANGYVYRVNVTFSQLLYNPNNSQNTTTSSDTYPIPFFGNNTILLKVGSVKYSFIIEQWLFDNNLCTLELTSKIKLNNLNDSNNNNNNNNEECGSESAGGNSTTNDLGDVGTIISIYDGGKVVYARIPNKGLVDNFPIFLRNTVVKSSDQSINTTVYQVTSSIPHFFSTALIDPDFSLLINEDGGDGGGGECGDDDSDENWKKITIGVVVGVVGGAIVAISIAFLIKKNSHQFKIYTYKLRGHSTT